MHELLKKQSDWDRLLLHSAGCFHPALHLFGPRPSATQLLEDTLQHGQALLSLALERKWRETAQNHQETIFSQQRQLW